MAENKTKPGKASVEAYLGGIADAGRQADCRALVQLLRKVTKEEPVMWGSSIVGFGSYHYVYDSGREGDMCVTGFSARKNELVVYLVAEGDDQPALLAKLGKHRMGKACLYFRRLADLDTTVLEQLVKGSIAEVERRYGRAGR